MEKFKVRYFVLDLKAQFTKLCNKKFRVEMRLLGQNLRLELLLINLIRIWKRNRMKLFLKQIFQ